MARSDPPKMLEVWMKITPRGREVLLAEMKRQGVSGRVLATVAGYRSSTHLQRVLRGEHGSLPPQRAHRIAEYLHMPVHAFFLAESSSTDQQSSTVSRRPLARRKPSPKRRKKGAAA